MPYYDNDGANITFFRISMATDPGEVSVEGTIQLHMHYVTPNPAASNCGSHVPPCLESNQYLTFTLNDYVLLNTAQHNRAFDTGWVYAYATLDRPDRGVARLVWDRFFSDTLYVDTALGTAAAWSNYANWADVDWVNEPDDILVDLNGNDECDYSVDIHYDQPRDSGVDYPDVCLLNQDFSGQNNPIYFDDEYFPELFADIFFPHYFTEFKFPVPGGPPMTPTEYIITVMGWEEGDWAPSYRFPPGEEAEGGCFSWNGFAYNAHERQISTSPQAIVCQAVLDIHELTLDQTLDFRFPEGFVKLWDEQAPGGEDSRDAIILQIERWTGLGNIMMAHYSAHERTSAPAPWFGWMWMDDDRTDDAEDWP
jgi:hypothetical protein